MATSGSLLTNGWYSSSKGDYVYLEFTWTATQSTVDNASTISWSLKGKRTASSYTMAGGFQVVIDGETVYNKSTDYRIELRNGTVVASGTKKITHKQDGTRSFEVYIAGGINTYAVNCTGKTTFYLDAIPRKATITAVSDFTDTDNPSITFSNPGGFPMNVWLEPNPIGTHLCEVNNIPNTGKYTWNLTAAERDQLRNSCPGRECTIRVGLYTNIGGTLHADYKDKKYTITENSATKPAVTLGASLNNSALPSTFAGLYVQGKSKVDVELSAVGKYGASIKSYSAQVDGKTYNFQDSQKITSDVLQSTGSVKIIGYAKDSREFTGSAEETVNVIAYSKPLVIPLGSENAILCYRSDGNGNRIGNSTSLWIKAKRSYHDVSGKNTCALQWRRKLVSEEWSDNHEWADLLTANSATNEYNASVPGVFDLREAYTIQIMAIDTIGEYDIKTFEIPTQDVALHLGKGGKNVAIGTYCDYSEERTFYSDWKAIFDKEVVIGGSPVVDHIVESGTFGIWTYEKMASGIARCWAKIDYSVDLVSESIRAYVQFDTPFPIEFEGVPFCGLTLSNQTTWNHVLSSCDFTESLLKGFSVYRLGAGATVTAGGTANIRAVGYWK